MTSFTFYLCRLLPIVFAAAMFAYASGSFVGWLLWSHYAARSRAIELQNETLRNEIRRLTA